MGQNKPWDPCMQSQNDFVIKSQPAQGTCGTKKCTIWA